ncbi:recombinase family protein [Mycolicibacterium sp. XJ2]
MRPWVRDLHAGLRHSKHRRAGPRGSARGAQRCRRRPPTGVHRPAFRLRRPHRRGPALHAELRPFRRHHRLVALDRLGRTGTEVTRTIAELCERGLRLRTLKEGLDTGTSTGRVVASVIKTLARLDSEDAAV